MRFVPHRILRTIKYTPAAGSIDVRLDTENARARVTVSDSGPGIPSEAHKRVFRRFYRLEESRSIPGNGLRLSLVAAVAQLHAAEVKQPFQNLLQ